MPGNGHYEVGCADIMVKGEQGDLGVFARIFYPSTRKGKDGDSTDDKVEDEKVEYPIWRPRQEYLDGLAQYREMSPKKINFFFDWLIGERRIPAGWHASLYTAKGEATKFPVLVFSHGISGNRLCYSTFCAALASYGYVVAAVEHRDRSSSWTYYLEIDPNTGNVVEKPVMMDKFPDGEQEFKARNKQLHKRAVECVRTLHVLEELNLGQCGGVEYDSRGGKIIHGHEFDWSQFKNRLDISKAGVMGHSFGGAAAVAAAAFSTDFQTSVVLDGWFYPIESSLYSKTTQPALLLNASKWQWSENVKRMRKMDHTSSEKIMITIKDIVHQSFSDFAFLKPGYIGRRFNLQGDLDPLHTAEAILEIIVTYLKQCFNGERASESLRELIERYSHFIFEGTDIELDSTSEENNVV